MSQTLTGPQIGAVVVFATAVIGWLIALTRSAREHRRDRRARNADLAAEVITAVAAVKGEVIMLHETWTRHQRRLMLLAAAAEYLAAGSGLQGYGSAARTVFRWERERALSIRQAISMPLTQLTASAVRVSYAGTPALANAAYAVVMAVTQIPTSVRSLKRYTKQVDKAVEEFTEVARREAGKRSIRRSVFLRRHRDRQRRVSDNHR